jgi:hypothetical protein
MGWLTYSPLRCDHFRMAARTGIVWAHSTFVRSLRDQARIMDDALFFKQVGNHRALYPAVRHSKGEDPNAWPFDLQRQEFPIRLRS